MDEIEINERYQKLQKAAIWCVVGFVILILYFFAYPIVLVKAVDGDYLNDIPDWLEISLEASVAPIDWIYKNAEWYKSLIDEWSDRI